MVEHRGNDQSGLDERLRTQSPFNERRIPSSACIGMIQNKVQEPKQRNRMRLVWVMSGSILAGILLILGLIVANDIPGGFADRKLSHVIGMDDSLHIPLGSTPEEALEKFRRLPGIKVIHGEPIQGGVLLFTQRAASTGRSNLQVDYMRQTWLGWKWGCGGGYGMSHTTASKSVLEYMSMQELKGVNYPFPLMFGIVRDPSIENIEVEVSVSGKEHGIYAAKLVKSASGDTIWFVLLPKSSAAPYELKGLSSQGAVIASKTIKDPQDYGEVDRNKK
ncbi:hypothetical protein Back11_39860 [Paenibacillus baekrokdamisoli]|uniref:Uncharacterized protein n=1 Tax=Paenibacillus baekrokdamisoli TaxID=1712516 RepID=A0A3G9J9X1_9BACL|nr:hypothetical protein [Paenibacillus baekrokdamisoli]MBB3068317.1 hypothetical protein [Paenibacillus baekrokdamisoli]BBH22641.1 hypothetical protein Back11_39860 [Paenibacillus baekrokdamisoli]